MRMAAADALPQEACGLLLGASGIIDRAVPVRNVAAEPLRHFEIDPQALIDAHRAERQGGPELIGYFHSHPVGRAAPSPTDRARASGDGKVWAIIAKDDVTFWTDDPEGFAELSYRITDS
ncbi:M67 family peptidase [Altericroceibacterium spongiae]|uniref:M67 family peptidase n=1 Tax=Altericroceibacterium spongiae TaxID=2320269 RepID=A0A420EK29_9SPHN|nr:M67 family peptidase [Altericroceibacterium spongiae]